MKKAFTLIELLVVISIIGILVSIGTVSLTNVQEKGRDTKRKNDLSAIKSALELYYQDNGQYPDGTNLTSDSSGDWIPGLVPDYIQKLPKDPKQAGIISSLAKFIPHFDRPFTKGKVAAASMKSFPEGVIRGIGNRVSLPSGFFQTYPWVGGFAVIEFWSYLQPKETEFDWSYLDNARDRANADGKPVIFLIETGGGTLSHTPSWLLEPPYNRPVLSIDGETHMVPWDPVYRQKWLELSAQIAARYDNEPMVAGIYVAGVQSQYPEMIFKDSTAWTDNTQPPPNGIQATTGPNNPAFDAPDGTVYADAWKNALQTMVGQFQKTWIINMVDWVPNPSGPERLYGPFDEVKDTIDSLYASRATIGTANMGDKVDLSEYKYQQIRASQRAAPIVYEIGPAKLSGNTDDLYEALRRCRDVLGCKAAIVHRSSWETAGNPEEAKRAYEEFWLAAASPSPTPSPTPTPTATPEPSPSPSPSPTPTPSANLYRYDVGDGLQSFTLWARLENEKDSEIYNQSFAPCQQPPPANTNYNYCLKN